MIENDHTKVESMVKKAMEMKKPVENTVYMKRKEDQQPIREEPRFFSKAFEQWVNVGKPLRA